MSKILITEHNAADHLVGEAMPKILKRFRAQVIGRKIVNAGYVIHPETPWGGREAIPVLVLDNGELIEAMRDDEGNGPGVFTTGSGILCEVTPK